MKFLRWLNPVPGIRDFAEEFARPNPHRWRIVAVAAACTFAVFSVMWGEEHVGQPPKPDVIWISTFAPDRTDEEIIASNIENQKRKDEFAAEQARRNAEVREIYRTLGNMSGMDADRIIAEADAERAKEEQAAAEAQARLRSSQEKAAAMAASQTEQQGQPAGERQE